MLKKFRLNSAYKLTQIYGLPDLEKPLYVAEGLSSIPPLLSPEFVVRRAAAKETLTEIMVANLGDESQKSPYLIVSSSADLVVYCFLIDHV